MDNNTVDIYNIKPLNMTDFDFNGTKKKVLEANNIKENEVKSFFFWFDPIKAIIEFNDGRRLKIALE